MKYQQNNINFTNSFNDVNYEHSKSDQLYNLILIVIVPELQM